MAPASGARSDAQSVAATGAQSDRRAPPSALALGVASAADGVPRSGTASVSALVVPSDLQLWAKAPASGAEMALTSVLRSGAASDSELAAVWGQVLAEASDLGLAEASAVPLGPQG